MTRNLGLPQLGEIEDHYLALRPQALADSHEMRRVMGTETRLN
jgi:hypothetical protein